MTGNDASAVLNAMRRPIGDWRGRARARIIRVLADNGTLEGAELLAAVDAAYPFGERRNHPYKAWLSERRILIRLMAPPPIMPSPDEAAACLVAHDLVQLGREDEARALLDAQAPNRLARRCPTCGAAPAALCFERTSPNHRQMVIVPHEARLTGYIADPCPLFAGRAEAG